MDIQIFGKNIDINDTIIDYARKKTDKLARLLPIIDELKIEITEEKTKSRDSRYTVQITIKSKWNLFRAEERAQTINLAIDSATDALSHQISRFKGKFIKKGRGTISDETPSPDRLPEIVRMKRFLVKSMSVGEAAEQMELLSHDFFLFLNDDSGVLNLLYRRKDGDYGLIEPELDID